MLKPPEPSKTTLRQFGLILALILAVLFGAIPLGWTGTQPHLPIITVAAILALTALALPKALKYPYKAWMVIGEVLGWINTRVILGVVFVGLFFPIGLFLKLLGKDPLRRRLDNKAISYRVASHHQSHEHLERPY